MRETPWYISKAIHARDPLADVRWDDRLHVWVLYWDNVRICALFHADGSDMQELCVDEILDIMGKYDNYNDGAERLAAIRRTAANAKYKAEQRKRQIIEETERETHSMCRTLTRGANPQVYIKNNPLATTGD